MRRMWSVAIALLAVVLAGVAPAWAGGFRSHGRSGFMLKNTTGTFRNTTESLSHPVDPWKSWGVPRDRVPRVHRNHDAFVPFVPFGGSTLVSTAVSSPTTIIFEGVVGPAPTAPLVAAGAVPPVPPIAPLVEYAEGWYQLQGDGVALPYRWVWIPRPPAPPAPAAAAPASGPGPEPPAAGPRIGDAYQWTDEQGVTIWTNRPERIPQRFRSQAMPAPDAAPR